MEDEKQTKKTLKQNKSTYDYREEIKFARVASVWQRNKKFGTFFVAYYKYITKNKTKILVGSQKIILSSHDLYNLWENITPAPN